MCRAAFPFFPVLSAIVEAAVHWDLPAYKGSNVLDAAAQAEVDAFNYHRRGLLVQNLHWWEEQGNLA